MKFKATQNRLSTTQLQQTDDISCVITNISCTEIPQQGGRSEKVFTLPNGSEITLQRVNLRISGTVEVTLEDLTTESTGSICESYYLCAPLGTTIDCQVTDYTCQVCTVTTNNQGTELEVIIDLCLDIQSTFNVILDVEASFCTPRAQEIQNPCLSPLIPQQCPIVFGNNGVNSEDNYPILNSNQITRISQQEENLCIRASKVYDWIQSQINTTVAIRIREATGRIFNVDQGTFYDLIDVAVEEADSGDTLLVSPGDYIQDNSLVIDKPLTIRGRSAEQTRVIFRDTQSDTARVRLQADNDIPTATARVKLQADAIILERLSFIGPTKVENEEDALVEIPQRAPGDYYKEIAIRDSILEGGKRIARIKAEDLTLERNTFIHKGDEESLAIEGAIGDTAIEGNTFRGGALSRSTITFARAREADRFTGTLRLEKNKVERHTQLALFDTRNYEDASILVRENEMDHQDREGNSIVFLPFEFPEVNSILIEGNDITNPNSGGLAVYVDYSFGGETSPGPGQIQVLINRFVFEQPWGEEGDIILPAAPVGFTAIGLDFNMGPEDFVLEGNIVPNVPPQVTE